MFRKILIANRGEIAVRIIRTCRDMGIKTVAVYSTADRDALHVKYADEQCCIGPPPPAESYLKHASIITVAQMKNADAVHPGVGFLSEDSQFAEICEAHRITFIGPSVDNLVRMGNKAEARETMSKLGLKLVPGSRSTRQGRLKRGRKPGVVESEDEAVEIAERIGYPVGIKASAGGGGRGIRIANNQMSLLNLFHTAKAEAESAFGNADVYIEKWIENARHIEVQILADKHGNVVHLGERECSIQRKQQKLLEEAPSPSIGAKLRAEICKAAVKAAKSINYSNVGTIEFVVDLDDNFYFLEMNTRLQVEHTVTEMTTGIDLVREQIRVAAGEQLGYSHSDVRIDGHAIECRINAEDAQNNFIPSPGEITAYLPPGGIGIRTDSHLFSGHKVPPYYDSLIAKLISHGRTREEAIIRMRRALEELSIGGVKTTTSLHQEILRDERFLSGRVDTGFLEAGV
ncbi:MAG: acetyl-CoA carboxylase biotin carboxylase subunit [Candidatus Poribacteria bacterium]|nr:acetyl-CoA carboxylase biotin carboxylase subunit [Candidatus Poribacteria bacterium]